MSELSMSRTNLVPLADIAFTRVTASPLTNLEPFQILLKEIEN